MPRSDHIRLRMAALVVVAAAAAIGACSATTYSQDVIAAEATWLCDIPRFAYESAVDIDAELDVILESAGVERATYDEFKEALDTDASLRDRVAAAFDEACGEVT